MPLRSRQENGNSTILAQAIYYRVAGSSEPTSYTWTFSPAESGAGGIAAYRGVNNSTPIDTSSGAASTSNGTAITAPSITTSGASEVVVGFFGTSKNQSVPAPTGMTQRWDVTPATELEAGASDITQGTAGATGSKTATVGGNAAWVGQLVALRNVCVGGSLNLTAPGSVSFPSASLTGSDQLVSTTTILTPEDETGSGAGWNITGTSTPFTNGTHSLPTTATRITAASVAAVTGNCSLPTNGVTYPVTLPAAATPPTPAKLYNAAASTGKGPANVTLTAQLSVPANTYTGTYSSTWTLTIASGP